MVHTSNSLFLETLFIRRYSIFCIVSKKLVMGTSHEETASMASLKFYQQLPTGHWCVEPEVYTLQWMVACKSIILTFLFLYRINQNSVNPIALVGRYIWKLDRARLAVSLILVFGAHIDLKTSFNLCNSIFTCKDEKRLWIISILEVFLLLTCIRHSVCNYWTC